MGLLLGFLLFAFAITSIAIVPYINFLYKIKFQRQQQITKDAFGQTTPIFDKFNHLKAGTPVGGGLLIIIIVCLVFALLFPLLKIAGITITENHPLKPEIIIIFFTFISFGLLGLYDDILKFFRVEKTKFFGLRLRHKFILQWLLAFIIAYFLYAWLQIDIMYIPFVGVFKLGAAIIPLAAFVIVTFTNAVNITDGLDGLASGILMIVLFSLWFLSSAILDTALSVFLSVWLGSLIAFIYFNVYPARFMMGDVGALAFGATIAVVGLLIGKTMALFVIGGLFIVELTTSFLQLSSKKLLHRKLFKVAPFHLWLQQRGWEEPKIVTRAWLAAIMLAVFGLWLAVV